MKRFVIAALVENKYGVLTRVAGLFMRKGFNIDSLTVGETDDPAYSRITVTLMGDDYAREQLINQLKKPCRAGKRVLQLGYNARYFVKRICILV